MGGNYFYWQKFAINCGKTAKTEQNIKKWTKEAFLRI